jgi:hypothetical protein
VAVRRRKLRDLRDVLAERFVTAETSSHGENGLTLGPFGKKNRVLETPAKPLLSWRLVES